MISRLVSRAESWQKKIGSSDDPENIRGLLREIDNANSFASCTDLELNDRIPLLMADYEKLQSIYERSNALKTSLETLPYLIKFSDESDLVKLCYLEYELYGLMTLLANRAQEYLINNKSEIPQDIQGLLREINDVMPFSKDTNEKLETEIQSLNESCHNLRSLIERSECLRKKADTG